MIPLNSIGNYRIPDTDKELVPPTTQFAVSPGVFKGEFQGDYVKRMFDRMQEVCMTDPDPERGTLVYDKVRGQTIIHVRVNEADMDVAPILRHLGVEEVWLVLEPPAERWQ